MQFSNLDFWTKKKDIVTTSLTREYYLQTAAELYLLKRCTMGTRQYKVLYSDLSDEQEKISIDSTIEVIDKKEMDIASYLKAKLEAQHEVR